MVTEGFDIGLLARNIRAQNAELAEKAKHQRAKANIEGKRIASEIKKADPNIKAVWGFGSTFEEDRPFHLNSDIDLAIEGGDIISAWLIADRSSFKVDVVDITKPDGFTEMIKAHGVLLE